MLSLLISRNASSEQGARLHDRNRDGNYAAPVEIKKEGEL